MQNKKVVLIFGLQGSGKTTLATQLGIKMNGVVLTTEVIRAELFDIKSSTNDTDFSEIELKLTYKVIELLLVKLIDYCDFIVIEGVFRSYRQRNRIKTICEDKKVSLVQLYLTCSEHITKKRLEERKKRATIQPGGYQTYLKLKEIYEYPLKNEITIDNSKMSLQDTLNQLTDAFR